MSKKTFLSALILTALGAGLAAAQPILSLIHI